MYVIKQTANLFSFSSLSAKFPFAFYQGVEFIFFVTLIHWKDYSHVISTFNLANEDSWLS